MELRIQGWAKPESPVGSNTNQLNLSKIMTRFHVFLLYFGFTNMAKAKTKAKASKRVSKQPEDVERLTLQVLDAVSSDEDEDDGSGGDRNEEWNAEALALRQAIAEGAFDHLLSKKKVQDDDQEEEYIEIGIDDNEIEGKDGDDEERSDKRYPTKTERNAGESNEKDQNERDESEDEKSKIIISTDSNGKALAAVYEELCVKKQGMAWSESFAVLPEKPLPFGGDGVGSPLDVHDDLKRELAFYNMALDAVSEARMACIQLGIPFSRPDDFFAEMVKTDGKLVHYVYAIDVSVRPDTQRFFEPDHMAKVKDRLIFETKKMDAVAQRKANKEQKLLSKEKATNKLLEKSKRKKEHFQAVDEWAKSAAQNRGPALRDDDNARLAKMTKKRGWTDRDGNIQDGPNKKRNSCRQQIRTRRQERAIQTERPEVKE